MSTPAWNEVPGVIEVSEYNSATKTLVGSSATDDQDWVNIFTGAPGAVLAGNAYVHTRTVAALLAEVVLLFHLYPNLATLLPVRGNEANERMKQAIASAQ